MQSSREQQEEIKKILSEQCKEIEENITMGKTSNLFMQTAYFHAKINDNKGQNQ